MVNIANLKKGDVIRAQCCDSCARIAGIVPKSVADSGINSLMCDVCGHYGIGSKTDCLVGGWLRLIPTEEKNVAMKSTTKNAKDGAQRKRDHDQRQRDMGRNLAQWWVTPEEKTALFVKLLEIRRENDNG